MKTGSGTRRRQPGGGVKGKLPTMAEKLQFVLLLLQDLSYL